MNYLRMLAVLLCAILSSIGMCAYGQSVWTLEDIFERAETSSVQLRPAFSAQDEADKEISVAKNASLLSSALTDLNPDAVYLSLGQLYGYVQVQALIVSMKEIYGWLLIIAIFSFIGIIMHQGNMRPFAVLPKWRTVRKSIRRSVESAMKLGKYS